jgi:hypothetical protein
MIRINCKIGHFKYHDKIFNKNHSLDRPCTFYAKYLHTDIEDLKSPFYLCEYDISHNHPLNN